MKKSLFGKFGLLWLVFAVLFTFTACEKDNGDGDNDDLPLVEDGFYIVGEATPFTEVDPKGALMTARNEVTQEDRVQLKEIYIALKGGSTFSIKSVAGADKSTWGPGADFAVVPEAERDTDEPKVDFWRGTLEEGEAKFTVPSDGLYHVVIDTELKKVVVAPVTWGVIGAATPNGWSGYTALDQVEFSQEMVKFEKKDVVMVVGDFKFRYSDGWKINFDTEYDLGGGEKGIKVNTNFGESVSALVSGGGNIAHTENGLYTITMVWSLEDGTSASLVKTGEYTPPAYPDAMYLVGDATAYGWDAPGTSEAAIMHKAAGGAPMEGIFWKIAHLETGKGFKLSAANWGDPNLGFAEVTEFDANGVAITDNGGNMSVAESGMYMIVVNLQDGNKKVSVVAPKVYGMGDAFGGWDEDKAENLFTVDNAAKTITSPALTAAGNIRSYVDHEWIKDWWNAEFVLVDGVIEYRNDGSSDPTAVPGTAGQVVTYNFDDNTGTIQ